MSASTSTSTRFQSFALKEGSGGAANIETNPEGPAAPRPPPPRPAPRPPPPAACGCARRGRRRREPRLASGVARQRLAVGDLPLRVHRDRSRRSLVARDERVDAPRPVGSLLGSHHDAGGAPGAAAVRRRELHVLVALVEQQPAALGRRRRADNLAVLDPPRRLSELLHAGERRPLERPVRGERSRRLAADVDRHGGRRNGGQDECCDLSRHGCSLTSWLRVSAPRITASAARRRYTRTDRSVWPARCQCRRPRPRPPRQVR